MKLFLECKSSLPAPPGNVVLQPRGCYTQPPPQARKVEEFCVERWRRQGVQPPPHPLVPDPAALSRFLRHPDEW